MSTHFVFRETQKTCHHHNFKEGNNIPPPPHPTEGPASERGYACSYRHGCYAWRTQWSGKVKCDSSTYPFPYPLPPRFDPLLHVLVVHLPDGLPRVHSAHEDFQRHFFQLCILNKNKIKIARRYCVFDSY